MPSSPTMAVYGSHETDLIVERAVLSERERCAKIADAYERKCGSVNGREAALSIATEIRRVNI